MLQTNIQFIKPPGTNYNILQTLSWKIYQKLPRISPYDPNPFFMSHIGRRYGVVAWHSDWRVFFPHSIQYRMLRAITQNDMEEVHKILKHPNYRINEPIDKKYGYNALQFASIINQYTIIQLLLLHGANINCKDKHGNSPLMYAVDKHNLQSVNSLMKNGCNRHQKNNYQIDPIQKARSKPNQSYLVQFIQKYPQTQRKFPKFTIKLKFQEKINHPFWDYVKNYKIYETKPKIFPFNNFKGLYRVDFTAFKTVQETIREKQANVQTK